MPKVGLSIPWLLSAPAVFVLLLVFVISVVLTFGLSFYSFSFHGGLQGGAGFDHYVEVLSDSYFYELFGKTFALATVVSLLTLVLGTLEAYVLYRMSSQWRSMFLLLVLGPLLISVVVRTLGWTILLGREGLLNKLLVGIGLIERPLSILYTNTAVVIGLTHIFVPFVVLSVWACLQKCDPAVERAAVALGASQFSLFFRIVFPQVVPGMLSGGLVVFALAASAFATPALLGGRKVKVVSIAIYDQFLGTLNWPVGAVLATLMLILVSAIVLFYNYLVERRYKEVFQ